VPVYVAETAAQARSEPEASTVRSYRRLGENLAHSAGQAGTTGSEERLERAERLAHVSYDELLRDRLAYGTPDMVVERLLQWKEQLGLSGVIMEPNVGGRMPLDGVLRSIKLYANEVAPRLRTAKAT
jgi:alkanesulfonate monooxygenase SsuD/methylene tetrahydromethanopterin reductase-like flavin-dependent oxidoreductase (luciferase family)